MLVSLVKRMKMFLVLALIITAILMPTKALDYELISRTDDALSTLAGGEILQSVSSYRDTNISQNNIHNKQYKNLIDIIRTVDIANTYNYIDYKNELNDGCIKYNTSNQEIMDISFKFPTKNDKISIKNNLEYLYSKKNFQSLSKFDKQREEVQADLNYIHSLTGSTNVISYEKTNMRSSIEADLNSIILQENDAYNGPYIFKGVLNTSIIINNIIGNVDYIKKDYAIVVGINDYAEWRDLHTGINDANTMADILGAYGYEVLKLTDETEKKPTKHNILEGTLAKIKTKNDKRNVILYFSGHGTRDNAGNYYLVPQDAKKNYSYYISKKELETYIKNVENLAVIIDACNSGGFGITENAQMVLLASSGGDEPSNEKWLSSQSVFTYNLCEAIEEESKLNDKVILQRCFDKAKIKTSEWSKQRFLSQTPKMIDNSKNGIYYLN